MTFQKGDMVMILSLWDTNYGVVLGRFEGSYVVLLCRPLNRRGDILSTWLVRPGNLAIDSHTKIFLYF